MSYMSQGRSGSSRHSDPPTRATRRSLTSTGSRKEAKASCRPWARRRGIHTRLGANDLTAFFRPLAIIPAATRLSRPNTPRAPYPLSSAHRAPRRADLLRRIALKLPGLVPRIERSDIETRPLIRGLFLSSMGLRLSGT
jgi:hypothetical protein